MPEDEIVHRMLLRKIFSKDAQRLLFALEPVFHSLGHAALPGPAFAQTECKVGMEETEQALQDAVSESPAHYLVKNMAGTETVTVAEAELLSPDLHDGRLPENADAHFLKIMVGPDIVVALEEIDLHAGIHQIQQGGENSHIALRNHIVILVPEIPDVPQHVKGLCPLRGNRSQK